MAPSSCGGCEAIFDTAEEAIAHGVQVCDVVGNGRFGRVYDATGRTCCLWDGCGKPIAVSRMRHGKCIVGWNLNHVLRHEKEHVKGDAAASTGFAAMHEPFCYLPAAGCSGAGANLTVLASTAAGVAACGGAPCPLAVAFRKCTLHNV